MKEDFSGRTRESPVLWTGALVLMCAVVAFYPLLLGRTIVDAPQSIDIGNQWIPFSAFVKQCYLHFTFPLWDPHDLCGMPFLAFPHTESLYLPWVIEHLVAPSFHVATSLNVFFHLSLAALSVFSLLTGSGRTYTSAFCGAVGFAFAGLFFSYINFPPSLATCAWLAFWYAMLFRVLARPSFIYFVLCLAGFSGMIMGGDLETAVYGVLGACFEVVLRIRERTINWHGLFCACLAVAGGVLLSFPQLLPAQEMLDLSIRTKGFTSGDVFVTHLLLPVKMLFHFPRPSFLFYPSNNGLNAYYLGAFFILLIAPALRFHYSRRRLYIFPAAAIYMILMYSYPFNTFTSHIPVLGQMILSFRALPVINLFFFMAVCYALDRWIKGEGNKDKKAARLPFNRAGAAYLLGYGLLTLVSLYWFRFAAGWRLFFVAAFVITGFFGLFPKNRWSAQLLRRKRAVAVALVVLDIYFLALGWEPRTDPAVFRVDQRVSSVLSHTAGDTRYHILSSNGIFDTDLLFHLGLRIEADNIATFVRVPPEKSARRLALLYPSLLQYEDERLVHYEQHEIRNPDNLDRDKAWLLNRMNVGMILSRHPAGNLPGLELKPVLKDNSSGRQSLYAYKNRNAMPRAVLWNEKRSGFFPAEVEYPSPNSVRIDIPRGAPPSLRRLHISDSYYPGWRAWQGDKELKIETGKLGFRSLQLEGNGRQVIMRFIPVSFRVGLWTGLAFGAGVLVFLAAYLRRRTRQEKSEPCFQDDP
ncbi:MAG: hypothetical protein R6V10_06680 [bacterium]